MPLTDPSSWGWLFVVAAGALILGVFIAYGRKSSSERPRNPGVERRRDEATREAYDAPPKSRAGGEEV